MGTGKSQERRLLAPLPELEAEFAEYALQCLFNEARFLGEQRLAERRRKPLLKQLVAIRWVGWGHHSSTLRRGVKSVLA